MIAISILVPTFRGISTWKYLAGIIGFVMFVLAGLGGEG
jgi:hypothetical protein